MSRKSVPSPRALEAFLKRLVDCLLRTRSRTIKDPDIIDRCEKGGVLDVDIASITITDEGMAYFVKKRIERRKVIRDRIWQIVYSAISFSIGAWLEYLTGFVGKLFFSR